MAYFQDKACAAGRGLWADAEASPSRFQGDAQASVTVYVTSFGKEYHRVYGVCRSEEATLFHSEVSDRDYAWYLRAV